MTSLFANAPAATRLAFSIIMAFTISLGCTQADSLERARELQGNGRLEDSIGVLAERIEGGAEDPETLYRYGYALSMTGRPSQAIWPLRKAMEAEDWVVPAALELAAGGLRSGNLDEAIASSTQVLDIEPDNAQALSIRARARAQNRNHDDYEGAIEDTDRLLDLNPENRSALIPRAVALLALKRADEAAEVLSEINDAFEGAAELGEDEPRYCSARAVFAMEKGDIDESTAMHRSCLESHPTSPIVIRAAMEFFTTIGQPDEATAIAQEAFEAAPQNRDFRIGFAYRQQGSGDLSGAEQTLRSATESEDPLVVAEGWRDLAAFYANQRRYEDAVSAYERARDLIGRPSADFLFAFADALVLAGHYDRAMLLAREEIKVPAHAAMIEGRLHLVQGDPARALEKMSEALELWPNNAIGRYFAAAAAERIGDFDRAIEEYRYSARIDPSATDSRYRLGRILAAQNDVSLALSALQHSVGTAPSSVEMALLELELYARQSPVTSTTMPRLTRSVSEPRNWSAAVAAIARGTWMRDGPAAAANVVERSDRLDLADPANGELIRVYIAAKWASEGAAAALDILRALVERRADNPLLQALIGKIDFSRGEVDLARSSFERALELDAKQPEALLGLATLQVESNPNEALALYQRGLEDADLSIAELGQLARSRADVLATLGRTNEAIAQLEELLIAESLDAAAAKSLAATLALRDAPENKERIQQLLDRAARFARN